MADKRKSKKRKDEYVPPGEENRITPTKEEYKIAKWLKANVPNKNTKFVSHNVTYFTGKRAVDALVESQFYGEESSFKTRDEIVDFLDVMLTHKFFHRARKVPVSESELRKKKDKKDGDDGKESKSKDTRGTDAESSVVEGNKEKEPNKEKKKYKIRLEMHNDQRFVDSLDAYVWIYDPIPFYYWIFGALALLAAVGLCLFPLWPSSVRTLVYYLSVAAAGFLVTILVLAIVRLIFFCVVWVLTGGRHHIWILPNLTEDVGFLASFWPLYTYEYRGPGYVANKKGKKKKKDKESDAEDDNNDNNKEEKNDNSADDRQNEIDAKEEVGGSVVENVQISESESESSQRSSTFEMVDKGDFES